MGHSKVSLLDEMTEMGKTIMTILIKEDAVIKPEQLKMPTDGKDLKMSFVKEGHTWMSKVYWTQLAEVRRIKKMQPDATWERYKAWGGFDDHREVILLKKAVTDLRAAVVSRKRPDFFKKSKREHKKYKTKAGILKAEAVEAES